MTTRSGMGLPQAPRYTYVVAAILAITVAYAVLAIAIAPALPQDARPPAGMIVRLIVFTTAALALFALRSHDATAALSVLALAFSGIANAGPPSGSEWPGTMGAVMTMVARVATPLAFPVIALAILYFPSKSPLLKRYPMLHALPWLVAAPMLLFPHGTIFYASFAAALSLNVAAIAEGVYRYRFNHDANERRRIRMAVYTAVPGVLAYAIYDGWPVVAQLTNAGSPRFPAWVSVLLQTLVLLPAFGLVYAVGVQRVLGPRMVLRRSLQYALAARTLSIVAFVPVIPIVVEIARNPDAKLRDAATGVYAGLAALSLIAFKYRVRARQYLDQKFFREEYDARKILLSLASRVRFETDPADLASMVVREIDAALHPETIAILVSGIEDGCLTPVTVMHGSAETLPIDSGLVSMLRWSDDPLELFLDDPRSPAHRLPPEEREWLECTNTVLLVPVIGQDRALIALIALGEKRSEEAYTAEDRQLLASIAAQMGLGFDVARLRRRIDSGDGATTRVMTPQSLPMNECPRCGRCDDSNVQLCPADGTTMRPVVSVPRIIDNKYRMEQLLGRGGMGAVYRARDMRLDRLVAVKVVRAELLGNPEARRRFKREAQIVAKLQHPSIVSVFDYGTFADGGAYLVMELVRGEDLRRVLLREGRLDLERACRILTCVCGAIEAAHREGVLHRDLKPENILLPGGSVEAKVLDFGVAKVIADERSDPEETLIDRGTVLTVEGMIVGTPAYMAPEQLRSGLPDARTDVFSLGVITYEMLTGELPFGRGSLAEVILAQARGVPPTDGAVPPAVDRAVRAALEPDPDRRPASPQAFAHLVSAASEL
jgi:serine/threonine-protein kinase